jgi:hypothetical protein
VRFAAVTTEFLRRPPAAFAPGSALGTWLRVYAYAAEQETGGLLKGFRSLNDRQLLALAQVTCDELDEAVAVGLLRADGDDLSVEGYDLIGEAKVRAARENGALGGRPRKNPAKPSGKPNGNRAVLPTSTEAEPRRNLSSSLSSSSPIGTSTGGGGGGSAADSFEVSEADLRDALSAWTTARPRAAGSGPEPEARDLRAFRAALAKFSPSQRALIPKIAAKFYASDGKARGDSWWRDGGWSLHIFVSQGLSHLLGGVEADEIARLAREEHDRQEAEHDRRVAAARAVERELAARYPLAAALGPVKLARTVEHLGLSDRPVEDQWRLVQSSLGADAARGAS